jgi:transposase InsO family protein
VLRAYERNDQKTAIQFIDHVLGKLPFQIERVQTDNGAEFGQAFHWHLLDKGIDHVKIRARTPRLNGKVERSHRIDSDEFYKLLEGEVLDDTRLFAERLQQWEDHYNYDRPQWTDPAGPGVIGFVPIRMIWMIRIAVRRADVSSIVDRLRQAISEPRL